MPNYRNSTVNYSSYRQAPAACPIEVGRKDAWENMPLAMAYVPWQTWQNIYDAEKGFCNGTIFQELNLPFRGVGGCQK